MTATHTNFDSILEQCLSQMASGKARRKSCLLSYPAQADELEPLLLAAEELWTLPQPALSPEARARIETRLQGAVRSSRRMHASPRSKAERDRGSTWSR